LGAGGRATGRGGVKPLTAWRGETADGVGGEKCLGAGATGWRRATGECAEVEGERWTDGIVLLSHFLGVEIFISPNPDFDLLT
jgi:hypothetical protein